MASEVYGEQALDVAEPARTVLIDSDIGAKHVEKRQTFARAGAAERAIERLRAADTPHPAADPMPRPSAAPAVEGGEAAEPAAQGVIGQAFRTGLDSAKDVAHGVIESPMQIVGGVSDAVQNTAHIAREFSDWVTDTVGPIAGGGVIFDPWPRFASGDEIKQTQTLAEALLPDIDQADSNTGAFVRGTSKFVAGFFGAGKLKGIQALSRAGKVGAAAAPFVRGAIADLAVFEPHEKRLSNLIEEFPALQNPVTEFLAAAPDDGAAEGRFKNALEGLGLGAVTNVAVDGLAKGLKLIRSGRAANQAAEPVLRATLETADAQRSQLAELLGGADDAPLFEVRPAQLADDEIEAATRSLSDTKPRPDPQGEVFVNWNRIKAPDDVKSVIQEMADAFEPDITQARRGKVTWTQTTLDADQLDAWHILKERRVGQPLDNAQTVAVRELWVRSATKLRDLAQEVASDPSELNRIAFRKQMATHNAVQESVVAARTETARALNAWAIPAGDSVAFAGRMEELRGILRSDGTDTVQMAKALTALSDANMAREVDAFLYGSAVTKGSDAIRQLFYAALLSSPHTHMRNMIGNSAMIPMQLVERKAASLIGQVFGQQNIPDGETAAMLFGMRKGLRDAFRVHSKKARLAAGLTDDAAGAASGGIAHLNRLELPSMGALSAEKIGPLSEGLTGRMLDKVGLKQVGLALDTPFGRVMDWLDSASRIPTKALGVADDSFGAMAWNMELSAQAFRKARAELDAGTITREAFEDRLTTLVNNPDQYMRLASDSFRRRSTFTQTPGAFAQASMRLANRIPILGRLILPFRSTPFNIASETFQRTPLAPFVGQWRADLRAGGAQADLALSKMAVGSAVLFAMADLAMSGDITGNGPENPAERANLERMGWKPNSIRIPTGKTDDDGNPVYRYFQLGRGLEPISTPIGLAGNVVDVLRYKEWDEDDAQVDELVMAATLAIAAQATSQSYMTGVSDFFDAMSDPTRYGETYFERLAQLPVPRGVAQIARTIDPTARMVENMADAIKASTPGLSKTLPPNRDLWGRPVMRQSGLGDVYDAISPIYSSSTENAQPIDKELNRLELYLSKPPKRLSFDGVTVDLSTKPEIYSRLVELAGNGVTKGPHGEPITARGFVSSGKGLMDELNALVTGKSQWSGMYRDMLADGPDGGKAEQIRAIQRAYLDAAKAKVIDEFPALKAEIAARRSEKPVRFKFQQGGSR